MTQSQQDSVKQQLDKLFNIYHTHRIGSHSDDWGGDSDKPCFCDLKAKLQQLMVEAKIEEAEEILEVAFKGLGPEVYFAKDRLENHISLLKAQLTQSTTNKEEK